MSKSMRTQARDTETLLIFGEYPHSLMQHLLTLLRAEKKGAEWILSEEFFPKYSEMFHGFQQEIRELRAAKEKEILKGFWEDRKSQAWQQRVFIRTSLMTLLESFRECEAVELLESLMWVFGWKISVEIERKWQVSEEDQANFHSFQSVDCLKANSDAFDFVAKKHLQERKEAGVEEAKKENKIKDVASVDTTVPAASNSLEDISPGTHQTAKKAQVRNGKECSTSGNSLAQKHQSNYHLLEINSLPEEEFKKMLRETPIKYKNFMIRSMLQDVKRARHGNVSSQIAVAGFYAEKDTRHTDYFEAARWYSFAMRKGNDKAKFELGRLFDSANFSDEESARLAEGGLDASQVKQYGLYYFMELAEKGYPTAQSILGLKYCLGDGVEKNTAKGVMWLKRAAKQGHAEAKSYLRDFGTE